MSSLSFRPWQQLAEDLHGEVWLSSDACAAHLTGRFGGCPAQKYITAGCTCS